MINLYRCNNCGFIVSEYDIFKMKIRFCPSCGIPVQYLDIVRPTYKVPIIRKFNITKKNIKTGVSILGVTGNYTY